MIALLVDNIGDIWEISIGFIAFRLLFFAANEVLKNRTLQKMTKGIQVSDKVSFWTSLMVTVFIKAIHSLGYISLFGIHDHMDRPEPGMLLGQGVAALVLVAAHYTAPHIGPMFNKLGKGLNRWMEEMSDDELRQKREAERMLRLEKTLETWFAPIQKKLVSMADNADLYFRIIGVMIAAYLLLTLAGITDPFQAQHLVGLMERFSAMSGQNKTDKPITEFEALAKTLTGPAAEKLKQAADDFEENACGKKVGGSLPGRTLGAPAVEEIQQEKYTDEYSKRTAAIDDVDERLIIYTATSRANSSANIRQINPLMAARTIPKMTVVSSSPPANVGVISPTPNHPAARLVKRSESIAGRTVNDVFTISHFTPDSYYLSSDAEGSFLPLSFGAGEGEDGNQNSRQQENYAGEQVDGRKRIHTPVPFFANTTLNHQRASVMTIPDPTTSQLGVSISETSGVNTAPANNTWPALSQILDNRSSWEEVNTASRWEYMIPANFINTNDTMAYRTSSTDDTGFSLIPQAYAASGPVSGGGRGMGCTAARLAAAFIRQAAAVTKTRLWQMMPAQRSLWHALFPSKPEPANQDFSFLVSQRQQSVERSSPYIVLQVARDGALDLLLHDAISGKTREASAKDLLLRAITTLQPQASEKDKTKRVQQELDTIKKEAGEVRATMEKLDGIPTPEGDNGILEDEYKKWLAAQENPAIKQVLGFIGSNIRRISFPRFLLALSPGVRRFEALIGSKPYVTFGKIAGSGQGESGAWVSDMVRRIVKRQAINHELVLDIGRYLEDHPEIYDAVMVDDASYTATQLTQALGNNVGGVTHNEKLNSRRPFNFYAVLPYVNKAEIINTIQKLRAMELISDTGNTIVFKAGQDITVTLLYEEAAIEFQQDVLARETAGLESTEREKLQQTFRETFGKDEKGVTLFFAHRIPDNFTSHGRSDEDDGGTAIWRGDTFDSNGQIKGTKIPFFPEKLAHPDAINSDTKPYAHRVEIDYGDESLSIYLPEEFTQSPLLYDGLARQLIALVLLKQQEIFAGVDWNTATPEVIEQKIFHWWDEHESLLRQKKKDVLWALDEVPRREIVTALIEYFKHQPTQEAANTPETLVKKIKQGIKNPDCLAANPFLSRVWAAGPASSGQKEKDEEGGGACPWFFRAPWKVIVVSTGIAALLTDSTGRIGALIMAELARYMSFIASRYNPPIPPYKNLPNAPPVGPLCQNGACSQGCGENLTCGEDGQCCVYKDEPARACSMRGN
ncbi:hypothetical protein HY950_03420, partial [Candidatus Gottesmanbacteria bacterium]|nr:hypothetical protein [Candidatus Gottesmanbacteria bacterium]